MKRSIASEQKTVKVEPVTCGNCFYCQNVTPAAFKITIKGKWKGATFQPDKIHTVIACDHHTRAWQANHKKA